MGNQFLNKEDTEKDLISLEKAWEKLPKSLDFALSYTKSLIIMEQYQKVKEVLLPFIETKKESFSLLYYLEKASQNSDKH